LIILQKMQAAEDMVEVGQLVPFSFVGGGGIKVGAIEEVAGRVGVAGQLEVRAEVICGG
jgi:hypothetical protein